MKFTCTKENIIESLGLVSGIAGRQSSLPILTNVYIEAKESGVEMIATNLEIALKTYLRAKVESTGSFTVPAKVLGDYLQLLPDEQITISLDGTELSVICGSSSTKIKGMPSDDFPVIPEIDEQHAYTIAASDVKDALQKTVIAASKNEIRPELAGICCQFFSERYKGLVLAATDSYRLAEKTLSVSQGVDEFSCIIPSRTAYEIIRVLGGSHSDETNVRLWLSDGQIALRYGQVEMTSRLVEGTYPDYTQIIPSEFATTAIVPTDDFIKRIKAASLFTSDGVNAVSFDMNAEQKNIGISSTSTQSGEHSSEIDGEIMGQENSILLNHRYVLDGLQHIAGSSVRFLVNSSEQPCMFRPADTEDYLYIVMPIRQ